MEERRGGARIKHPIRRSDEKRSYVHPMVLFVTIPESETALQNQLTCVFFFTFSSRRK